MRVYRWDLDKTYLDTDFESLRGIVRTATEPAHKKRALPGAAALLRALGTAPGASVMVVSGSPTQMRGVLSEKLRLDGIPFDELVLRTTLGTFVGDDFGPSKASSALSCRPCFRLGPGPRSQPRKSCSVMM